MSETKVTATELLNLIEGILCDDFCEDLAMRDADLLSPLERVSQRKIGQIYRIVHSLNKSRGCYENHRDWRKEVLRLLKTRGQP